MVAPLPSPNIFNPLCILFVPSKLNLGCTKHLVRIRSHISLIIWWSLKILSLMIRIVFVWQINRKGRRLAEILLKDRDLRWVQRWVFVRIFLVFCHHFSSSIVWSTRCGSYDWMQCLSEISARCQAGLRRRLAKRWRDYHFEIILHEGFSTSIWTTTSTSTWTRTLFGKEVLRLSLSDYFAGGSQTSTSTSPAASQVSEMINSISFCWRTFIAHEV